MKKFTIILALAVVSSIAPTQARNKSFINTKAIEKSISNFGKDVKSAYISFNNIDAVRVVKGKVSGTFDGAVKGYDKAKKSKKMRR